ncbi:MAG: F510_1955 family glycosylhydrolase [Acidimicrobiales bacterium]
MVLLVVVAAGVTWAAVRLRADGVASAPGDAAGDPGVAHVHGLGIDPADGSLHIATHFGTFRLVGSGPAERVGDGFQDTMGFTVVGANHFLGSGHPDIEGMQAGEPGRLGLIESTDAGETWRSVSLSGEADFHALAFAHDQVYGWDSTSGRFMVSADRTTWDNRSTLQLLSFAVDPDDDDHVIATTPEAVMASTDGGRTWDRVDGPGLTVVAWEADGGLWGATGSGEVYRSDTNAQSWTPAGALPGGPHAFLADGGSIYAAAEADGVTGIYRSTDGGGDWELLYRDERP